MRLLTLLLLLCGLSGSAALRGPRDVVGQAGSFVAVICQYDTGYERHRKWWCRGAALGGCSNRVETTGAEQVVRKDRVTIRDDQRQRRFTVTMERLRDDDAGTYWCGIEPSDQKSQVTVTITPAPTTTTVSTTSTTTTNTPTTAATTAETTDTPRVTRALSNTTGFTVPPLLLPVISAVFPLLLLAAALLAWRKLKRQRTAPEVPPEPDAQEEVSYAHLSLHSRDPEPTYANADSSEDPRAGRSPAEVATEYSGIRNSRAGI